MLHRSYAIWDFANKGSSQGMHSLRHSGLKLGGWVGRGSFMIYCLEINASFAFTDIKFSWSKDSHCLFASFLLKLCESSRIKKIMQRNRVTESYI